MAWFCMLLGNFYIRVGGGGGDPGMTVRHSLNPRSLFESSDSHSSQFDKSGLGVTCNIL